mgnify:CR=1 FL=1
MNTYEIERTVANDKCLSKIFLGVFASDQLPKVVEKPSRLIANTDPSNKPGQHWVALFFSENAEYFDSYGMPPLRAFDIYKPLLENRYCLQNSYSTACGEFCIYFLHKRVRGHRLESIVYC